jgi:hypothetical protein
MSFYLPIALITISDINLKGQNMLSRMVFETVALQLKLREKLFFTPPECIGEGRTTLRITEENLLPISMAFKKAEQFINETFEIFYEDAILTADEIENYLNQYNDAKNRIEFLFNFGVVSTLYRGIKNFKLEF